MIEIEFYSGKDCGICQVLKPKLQMAIREKYKNLVFREIMIQDELEYASQNSVFTLPVVIIKWEKKEQYRFVKSFAVNEVLEKLERLIQCSS